MGHIVDLDLFVQKTRIMIKLYRDPNACVVLVNGDEVYKWKEDRDSLPSGFAAVSEAMRERDGAWADMLDLRPGDEVIEDDDGTPLVIRGEDDETGRADEPRSFTEIVAGAKRKAPRRKTAPKAVEDDLVADVVWE